MRSIVLLLFLFSSLYATPGFWEDLISIQSRFYAPERLESTILETNATKAAAEANATREISQKFDAFNTLLFTLKNRPYELKEKQNPYFDPKNANEELSRLRLKIETNTKYGYTQAVIRDEIRQRTLQLKSSIYDFLLYLSAHWTDLDKKGLIETIKHYQEFLAKIDIKKYETLYRKIKTQKGEVAGEIAQNFLELAKNYYFFDNFLEYLLANPSILSYHSIANRLRLDNLITLINDNPVMAKANVYLRYLHLDMGRILLFIAVLLFFWLLNHLINRRIYHAIRRFILKEEDATDELILENLQRMRRPMTILIITFGLELALQILIYPKTLHKNLDALFYLIYLASFAYIVTIVIDNLFFVYLHKNRKDKLRAELLNLILSITKGTIFLIAVLLFLVKLGVNITGLLASLGIGGLAVALAAQDTLSNFFGLIKIIFDESFSQGDWIQTSDVEGTVVEIGFISTKIRTFDNAMITVPNAKLANTPLKNWNKRKIGRRIKMHIGVAYNADRESLMKAIEEIKRMLIEHPGIITTEKLRVQKLHSRTKYKSRLLSLEDKEGIKTTLLVYLDRFSDSSIDILIYTFSKTVNWQEWLEVKEEVLLKIWEILDRHGLEFAFPSQTLYFDKHNIAENYKEIRSLK